jgi:hypothetical protein
VSLTPQYHPDADGMAFNVKDRCLYRRDLRGTEEQRNAAYERAQQFWWVEAKDKAIALGFSDIYSTGRSGGWLVPQLDGEVVHVPPTSAELFKLEELGTVLDAMMHGTEDRFIAELQEVLDFDTEEEAIRADTTAAKARRKQGIDALTQLARDVLACDTTSGCLKTQARTALELAQ